MKEAKIQDLKLPEFPTKMKEIQHNQIIVMCDNGEALFSYYTLVAAKINGQLYLTNYHDYSRTTSKYVTLFTGLNLKERRKAIENEEAIIINL